MKWKDRIEHSDGQEPGQAMVKAAQVPVNILLQKLSEGTSIEALLQDHPGLETDDIYACLAFSADKPISMGNS